jgi:hypothetical protein
MRFANRVEWPESSEVTSAFHEWEDDAHDWWVVEFGLTNLRGRLECVGFALHPIVGPGDWTEDFRPLRATSLRQLDFAGALTRARRDRLHTVEEIREWSPKGHFLGDLRTAERLFAETVPAKSRSKYSASYLRRVAHIYQAAYENGESAPAKFVEREMKLTPDVARKLVHRCRLNHLLPPAEGTKPRGWLEGERDEEEEGTP